MARAGSAPLGRTQGGRNLRARGQLAFYFLLSIFPLLLFLTTLVGYFLRAGTTLREVFIKYLSVVAPAAVSGFIETTLQEVSTRADGGKLSIGLLLTLWASSSGMVATSHALNTVYKVKETRPWWKARLVALVLTGALVVLMLMPLGLIMYGSRIAQAIAVGVGLGSCLPCGLEYRAVAHGARLCAPGP